MSTDLNSEFIRLKKTICCQFVPTPTIHHDESEDASPGKDTLASPNVTTSEFPHDRVWHGHLFQFEIEILLVEISRKLN